MLWDTGQCTIEGGKSSILRIDIPFPDVELSGEVVSTLVDTITQVNS